MKTYFGVVNIPDYWCRIIGIMNCDKNVAILITQYCGIQIGPISQTLQSKHHIRHSNSSVPSQTSPNVMSFSSIEDLPIDYVGDNFLTLILSKLGIFFPPIVVHDFECYMTDSEVK